MYKKLCYIFHPVFNNFKHLLSNKQLILQIILYFPQVPSTVSDRSVHLPQLCYTLYSQTHPHLPHSTGKVDPPNTAALETGKKQWYWKTAVRESYYIIKKRHMQDLKISGSIGGGGVNCTSTSSHSTGHFSKIQLQFVVKFDKT